MTTTDDNFDINDFMRTFAPEAFVRCQHDRIEAAMTEIGLLVFVVECAPRGLWTVSVARDGELTYGRAEELVRLARPVLKRIKVLRGRTELHVIPVGHRINLTFVSDELEPLGIRYRQCSRGGQIVERRQSYLPLLRGAAARVT